MAANSVEFRVIVNADGLVTGLKQVTNFGNETQKTGKKAKTASDEMSRLNYTMNQGVVGASSAARSFSKLNQTIGSGNGGLVGAYATLAANTFAVSAAFNALRSAQQAEMVLKGLEEQGARTGRSLTVASDRLREVVGFGISATESMSATALFTSGGFSTEELERLGKVAQNTSLALGRNLPDSLDRLIKGTTKLEPELLDELGIMTKLGDATSTYALQNNKSALSLSAFEKRQAFLNAVLAEGELKFGGLNDKIEVNPYDKLAASFDNLTKETLGFVNNSLGVADVVKFLSQSTFGLVGALLLFASTIQKTLLGSLMDLSKASAERAGKAKEEAEQIRQQVALELKNAKATVSTELAKKRQIAITELSTKAMRDANAAIREGTLSQEGFDATLKKVERTRKFNETRAGNIEAGKTTGDASIFKARASAAAEEKKELESLKAAELKRLNEVAPLTTKAKATELAGIAATTRAKAQETATIAIQAAAEKNYKIAVTQSIVAIKTYSQSLKELRAAKIADAVASGQAAVASGIFGKILDFLKLTTFGAATGVRVLTSALLGLIGIIGTAALIIGALVSAYEYVNEKLFPNTVAATKKVTDAAESLTKVLETQQDAYKEYNRIVSSTGPAGDKVILSWQNQSNAAIELASSIQTLVDAQRNRSMARDTDRTRDNVVESRGAKKFGISETSEAFTLLPDVILKATTGLNRFRDASEENIGLVKTVDVLAKRMGKQGLEAAIIDVVGSLEKFRTLSADQKYEVLGKVAVKNADGATRMASAVDKLNSALSTGETAAAKFFNAAIPSTPFDEIVVAFSDINASLRVFAIEGKSAEQRMAVLTKIPQQLQNFMDINSTKMLDDYREASNVVSVLQAKGKELTKSESDRLAEAKKVVSESVKNLPILEKSLATVEKENRERQASIALAQAMASYEQARISKYTKFLSQSGEGTRAQLKSEERINNLQASGLKIQQQILENVLTRKKEQVAEDIRALDALKNRLLLEEKITLEQATQIANKASAEAPPQAPTVGLQNLRAKGEQISAGAAGLRGLLGDPFNVNKMQANREAAKEAEVSNTQQAAATRKNEEAQKALAAAKEKVAESQRSLIGLELNVKAARLATAAATAKNLTAAEQLAESNLAEANREGRIAADNMRLEDQRSKNRITNLKLEAINFGKVQQTINKNTGAPITRNLPSTEIATIFEESNNAIKNIESSSKSAVNIINKEIERVEASQASLKADDPIRAGLSKYIEELKTRKATQEEIAELQVEDIQNQQAIRLLQQAGLSDLNAELSIRQQIAQTSLKSLETQQALKKVEFDINAAKRSMIASAVGVEVPNQEIAAAEFAYKQAQDSASIKKEIIRLEYALLEAQARQQAANLNAVAGALLAQENATPEQKAQGVKALQLSEQITANIPALGEASKAASDAIDKNLELQGVEVAKAKVSQFSNVLLENFRKLGPDGEAAAAIFGGMTQITFAVSDAFDQMAAAGDDTAKQIGAVAGAMSQVLGSVISIVNAISNAKIAAVDKEIAAEEKRDGKSAASVAKLQALDKKKDAMARKQFNINKKLMMAQAVMATAAGVANALASAKSPFNFILAGIVGAMGAAQLAIIAGTQYQSASARTAATPPSTLSIGNRGNSVDLARGPSASAGGEVGFLRGSQGMGTNASNFNTIGSAYGGELMRGFGNRGFVVGEKGPEIITPETPINVTPANDVMPAQPLNATFNIQALDASGVEELLVGQRGNIIKMLREAANATGQGFLEDVNTNVYTRPNVQRL